MLFLLKFLLLISLCCSCVPSRNLTAQLGRSSAHTAELECVSCCVLREQYLSQLRSFWTMLGDSFSAFASLARDEKDFMDSVRHRAEQEKHEQEVLHMLHLGGTADVLGAQSIFMFRRHDVLGFLLLSWSSSCRIVVYTYTYIYIYICGERGSFICRTKTHFVVVVVAVVASVRVR